jgi:hypothetical protein
VTAPFPVAVSLSAALVLAGCGDKPCREGTVLLTVDYQGASSAADTLAYLVSVDGASRQSFTLKRSGSLPSETVEIDFSSRYPAGSELELSATATRQGTPVGNGMLRLPLADGCSHATLDISDGLTDGGPNGSPDAGSQILFADDFNRADSLNVGNGWIAKSPALVISNGRLARRVFGNSGYTDNLLYRPASEDALDVKLSVEVRFLHMVPNSDFPQLEARVREGNVSTPGMLDAYLLFPTSGSTAGLTITRQLGGNSNTGGTVLGSFTLPVPLDLSHSFRFTLSVSGTNPVQLAASAEVYDDLGKTWIANGSTTAVDADPARIQEAGTFGVSAGSAFEQSYDYSYDNFTASVP